MTNKKNRRAARNLTDAQPSAALGVEVREGVRALVTVRDLEAEAAEAKVQEVLARVEQEKAQQARYQKEMQEVILHLWQERQDSLFAQAERYGFTGSLSQILSDVQGRIGTLNAVEAGAVKADPAMLLKLAEMPYNESAYAYCARVLSMFESSLRSFLKTPRPVSDAELQQEKARVHAKERKQKKALK